MVQRAVLLLTEVPSTKDAEELAQRVAQQYSDETQTSIVWSLDTAPPDWINVGLADQLAAHQRDAGGDACFLTVVMCTDEEADEIYDE